jgi:mRNA deadenylase 3'-5' endonuclease subunit Ccr4/protein-tyrosine phosphatase
MSTPSSSSEVLALRWPNPPPFAPATGPLPRSNWLIPALLLCGAHPAVDCPNSEQAAAATKKLLDAGIRTIVCLQEPHEADTNLPYEQYVATAGAEILTYPIPDNGIPASMPATLHLISDILKKLQHGRPVYIHCWAGHGRTGTIASILLSAIYGYRAPQALDANQTGHGLRKHEATKMSPQGAVQRQFVKDAIDAMDHAKQHGTAVTSSRPRSGTDTMSDIPSFSPSPNDSHSFHWPSAPPLADASTAPGPTVLSNWIFPGLLCVGGYPSAAEQTKAKQYAQAMAACRFDVYVNLMQENELKRFRPYADLIEHYSLAQHPPLQPSFLNFPIPDGGVVAGREKEEEFVGLIYEIIQNLKQGKRLYIHCWGGHGRTGTIVSVILSVIDPQRFPVDEALRICQDLHSKREYNGKHKSPEGSQIPFVRAMVQKILDLPGEWKPKEDFQVPKLKYEKYAGEEDATMADSSENPMKYGDARARARARLASRDAAAAQPQRAGGGEGVIVIDSHGTASTTQATASVPSTPLRGPDVATRRLSGEQLKRGTSGNMPEMELMHHVELIKRTMLPIKDSAASSSSASSSTPASSSPLPPFTFLTMNTLADSLCTATSFPHTNAAALAWQSRKDMLIEEMIGANRHGGTGEAKPDIICLQEVDHYSDFFHPLLSVHGYSTSFFLKKPDPESQDGAAIFVRTGGQAPKFRVGQHETMRISEKMNQVCILVQLIPLDTSGAPCQKKRLYVATAHLKAKEGFEAIRRKQVELIMQHLRSFISRVHDVLTTGDGATASPSDKNPPHASLGFTLPESAAVIFAGDLNDTPTSPMYEYLMSHQAGGHDASSSNPFAFSSLYNQHHDASNPANDPSELFTTVKHRNVLVQRCIDYCFYTDPLRPTAILSVPIIKRDLPEYLPSTRYPSDHLSIAGTFSWK